MWHKLLLAAALFYAFLPGVLVTLPPKSSRVTVQVVHAVLFAVVLHYAMKFVKQYEYYGNHGPAGCPPTHYEGHINGVEHCLPKSGTRQNPPGLEGKQP
jgi:thiamine transporter ThiT